jgi:hypothetical protein
MIKTQVIRGDKYKREVWEFRLYVDFVNVRIFLDSYRKESKTDRQRKWRREPEFWDRNNRNGTSKYPAIPTDVEAEMRENFCQQIRAVWLET